MTRFVPRVLQAVAALAVLTGVAHAQTPLTILTPKGGEIWPVGVRRDIVWSSPIVGNARIDLSRDGGLTFPETLFSNTRNDGVQVWEVDGPPSAHCRLRITSLDDPTVTGESAADFAIVDTVVGMTVTSPNGGETWESRSEQLITWSAPGDANIPQDNVRVEISRDDGVTFETLFASTPNDGMEPWTVSGPAFACRIRVTRLDDPTLTDESDADFSITSGVMVTAPNGGEVWEGGSEQLITWIARGGGDVRIEISRDGGLTFETLFASTPNDGMEPWTVSGPPATCRIRISHVDDPTLADESDGDFFITPGVTVTAPNGDEVWLIGSQQVITWTAAGGGDVAIEVSRDGGPFETIVDRTPNDGAEPWTVTGPDAAARVRVTRVDDPTLADESDQDFFISETPGVTVAAPNGRDVWTVGSRQVIQWSGIGGGRVMIELSRDAGLSWETLFASTPNDGTQAWTVEGPDTQDALIRVTRLSSPLVSDTSDATFEITTEPLTLVAPQGGDAWLIGSQQLIRWGGTGAGEVGIDLSRDGGENWETLFISTPNDGAQFWTVTGPPTPGALMRIVGLGDLPGLDFSDPFTITDFVPPVVTVTVPNGGEVWVIGSQQAITWTAGDGDVAIEVSRDGGPFETIFDRTPNDGAELWTVTGPVTAARVRVRRLDDPTLADESDQDFFITQTPGVTVGEPNGGDVWTVGSRQLIRWDGIEGGQVMIELSRDAGLSWETLFNSTPNDGIQAWTVGGPDTRDALIRVTRLSSPLASDISDTTFEITTAPLTLVAPHAGDDWVIGTQQLIRWGGTGVGNVGIDLCRDPAAPCETLLASTPNDGAQFWTVTGPPTPGAIIRIVGLDNLPGLDFSEPFTISSGTLDLVQPNGGERWAIGSPQLITWSTTTGGTVSIELSRDGGDSWETVFANTPNDGSEPWIVTGPSCTTCLLRITNLVDPELQDGSEAPFAIFCSPSALDIGAGQTRTGALAVADCDAPHRPGTRGDLYTFTMPQTGVVTIDLRADDFDPYVILVGPDNNIIAQNDNFGVSKDARLDSLTLPAGGPYTIEVASSVPGGLGLYRVSLSRFDIKLLTPLGGELWKLGERRVVSWRSGAPEAPVDITLFRDGDLRVGGEPIALETANDGSEAWIVTPPASTGAVVRVCIPEGNLGTTICDVSGLITIAPCTRGETRTCYDGPQGTLGVGQCRAGSLVCGDAGVFGNCQGEAVPQAEVCGDGVDQDCNGSDIACLPCPADGCADDDPCTADACVNGGCQHERPLGFALLDCRQTALEQALKDVGTTCQATTGAAARKRFERKLARGLARVEKMFRRARAARNKRRCVTALAAARQRAIRLSQQVDEGVARNLLCEDASTLLARRITDVSAAIISLSSCDTTP